MNEIFNKKKCAEVNLYVNYSSNACEDHLDSRVLSGARFNLFHDFFFIVQLTMTMEFNLPGLRRSLIR